MLVFVDFEHATGYDGEHAERVLAARTRITYRLEDLSGLPCHLVRYDRLDQALLDQLGATALLISGNSVTPDVYQPDEVAPIHDILRRTTLPIFGFCGGFQLLAQALGAEVVALDGPVDDDNPVVFARPDGRPFEYGYHPVDSLAAAKGHRLWDGLSDQPVFRHAHGFHVPNPPDGFETLASTRITPVQVAVHEERKIVGTQFHPEYWTDEHPDGRTVIANFFDWAGLT